MNYTPPYAPNQQQPYKLKVPVIVLSFIALALGLVRFIVDANYYFEFKDFIEPIAFVVTLGCLVTFMLPMVVWFVYVLMPSNKSKATILAGIALLFVVIETVLYYVESYAWGYGFPDYFIFAYVTDALTLLSFIPIAIYACMGLPKKVFLIIPAFVGLVTKSVYLVLYLQDLEWLLEDGWYSNWYLIAGGCQNLAPILMYLAMILFAAANNSTPKVSPAQGYPQYAPQYAPQYVPQNAPQNPLNYTSRNAPQQMTPDAELRMIYNQLQRGIITQEEYQARRAKIIQHLN